MGALLAVVLANWRALALAGALLALALAAWRWDAVAYRRGYAACRADAASADQRRTRDAIRADEDARRCAADPECRMRHDPYERRE